MSEATKKRPSREALAAASCIIAAGADSVPGDGSLADQLATVLWKLAEKIDAVAEQRYGPLPRCGLHVTRLNDSNDDCGGPCTLEAGHLQNCDDLA